MKSKNTLALVTLFFIGSIIIISCKKEESLIDPNGLSKDINSFISEEILAILDSLGMPINRGGNPPSIEGTYLVSPNNLFSSNRGNDIIGNQFADLSLTLSEQNTENLTVITQTTQLSIEGEGVGSYIVGEGNEFTIFSKLLSVDFERNDSTLSSEIYSGTIDKEGIINFYYCLIMLDDYGDPNNRWIEIGDARVFYDSDGLAERVADTKSASLIESQEKEPLLPSSLEGQ